MIISSLALVLFKFNNNIELFNSIQSKNNIIIIYSKASSKNPKKIIIYKLTYIITLICLAVSTLY